MRRPVCANLRRYRRALCRRLASCNVRPHARHMNPLWPVSDRLLRCGTSAERTSHDPRHCPGANHANLDRGNAGLKRLSTCIKPQPACRTSSKVPGSYNPSCVDPPRVREASAIPDGVLETLCHFWSARNSQSTLFFPLALEIGSKHDGDAPSGSGRRRCDALHCPSHLS